MYYLYLETIHSCDILHVYGRHARCIVDHENCSLDHVHVDELAQTPPFVRHGGMVYWYIMYRHMYVNVYVITWTCRKRIRRPCKDDYIPLAHIQVDPLPHAQPTYSCGQ